MVKKASGWNGKTVLTSLYRIFDESPSRRIDSEALTQAISSDYPLQLCANRCIENDRVPIKAREIWAKLVKIIEF